MLALMALGLLLVAGFLQLSPASSDFITSGVAHLLSSSSTSTSPEGFTVYSPLISNGAANVSYPGDYDKLTAYALGLVNRDRASQGAPPVTLSSNRVGQQHANSMLTYDYFSHFDTQGFKPYMRYTLLGGSGAVSENVAYITWKDSYFNSTSAVESSVNVLEHGMMYNDSQCCANGHRLNIVNQLHNRVALGFAYNSTTLFFVEDFENYYVNLNYDVSSAYQFFMSGQFVATVANPGQIYVTYDGTPRSETSFQLNAGPREYDPGNLVGGVLPPCTTSCTVFASGVTVRATVWQVTSKSVNIIFDLSGFIQVHGAGVYTVYLLTGADTGTAITSISVFVS